MAALGLCCWVGFSPVVVSGGYSGCGAQAAHRVASLAAERRLQARRLQELQHMGSCRVLALWHTSFSSCGNTDSVMAHGLICSMAYGIFPDKGSKLYLLHWLQTRRKYLQKTHLIKDYYPKYTRNLKKPAVRK